ERHQRMAQPAELGADPAIAPGRRRARDEHVRAARDHVDFAGQTGNPQTMNHVRAFDEESDRATDRHANLVRGLDRWTVVASVHDAPPELLAADLDREPFD